jgi:hypothetical protein
MSVSRQRGSAREILTTGATAALERGYAWLR